MKRITKIILSLMAVLCIALYTMGVNATELGIRPPDMDKAMSLTVSVGEEFQEAFENVSQEGGSLCYDLYRIADIEDGFSYTVTDKFSDLKEELSKAAMATNGGIAPDWKALAQQALTIAVGGEGPVVNEPSGADYAGVPLDEKRFVDKGLYLLVARGTKQGSSVVKSVSAVAADGENNYEDAQYAVCVTIGANVYTISPQIVCVPTKIVTSSSETSETITTADSTLADGTWIYDLPIGLKMSVEPALSSIEINKTLTGHTRDEEVVCVFQVDVYYPATDTDPYSSEVYSAAFKADGGKSLKIDGLPIGAKVIVTEVYSGANYALAVSSPKSQEVTVSGDKTASVSFTNTRDNDRSGGGITNHFTYDGGSWNLTTPADNTQTANGVNDTNR